MEENRTNELPEMSQANGTERRLLDVSFLRLESLRDA
jgi:hypothetical protein